MVMVWDATIVHRVPRHGDTRRPAQAFVRACVAHILAASLDTERRRLAEERVADMAAAEGEAARGDRVAYQAIGAGAVASLIAAAVAPAGSAAVVAVVLAAVALVVVGSRLTTFGARIETRRSGRPHDDPRTSSPPSGAALSAVFGLISAVDGAAAAIGGLGGGKPPHSMCSSAEASPPWRCSSPF